MSHNNCNICCVINSSYIVSINTTGIVFYSKKNGFTHNAPLAILNILTYYTWLPYT